MCVKLISSTTKFKFASSQMRERERDGEKKKEGNPRTRDESVPARRSDPSTVGSVGVREKERLGRKGLSRTVM